jgi:formate/nitrite transporter FocA (FNT family)
MIETVVTFLALCAIGGFVGGAVFISVVMFLESLND